MHWSQQWLGRSYVAEVFDCAELVRQVVEALRGIKVELPAERSWKKIDPRELVCLFSEIAEPTDTPRDGDVVLMSCRGVRRCVGSHVGVYAKVSGDHWVLHNLTETGVIFHSTSQLPLRMMVLRGFYAWVT